MSIPATLLRLLTVISGTSASYVITIEYAYIFSSVIALTGKIYPYFIDVFSLTLAHVYIFTFSHTRLLFVCVCVSVKNVKYMYIYIFVVCRDANCLCMYCRQFDWQVLVTSLSLKLPEHYFIRHSLFSQHTNLTFIFVSLGL